MAMNDLEGVAVDGRNPAQVEVGRFPIIYKVLCIPGGCLKFLPSTVLGVQYFETFSYLSFFVPTSQDTKLCRSKETKGSTKMKPFCLTGRPRPRS